VRREHRLQGARRRDDALSPDSRRRCAPIGRHGHAAQGDGEVSQLAIEAPVEHAQLTLSLRDDLALTAPIAWAPDAWLTFGFDEDLDEAAAMAIDGMLELMGREHGLERREALALASVVVDLRVTQMVNGARGIHARLAHDALR
jgi:acetamidase/formamidase